MPRNILSSLSLSGCFVFILLASLFYYPKWNQTNTEATISWDVSGYYFYLPAAFIFKDVKHLKFKDSVLSKYHPTPDFQQAYLHKSGNYVMKYTMGQAIMAAPFFALAHLYAVATNFSSDGFSFPYQLAIGLGMLLYSFIGLMVLRKTLSKYFSDSAIAITMVVIVFATNYLDYAAIDGAMTHNTLFTLYSLLLYFTVSFYQSPDWKKAVYIGCCVGLLTLIRPTEIISIIIPLCWRIATPGWLKFLRNNRRYLIVASFFTTAILFLQALYWHWVTGSWVVYSYRNEGFSWFQPHIFKGLFSYRAGWLVYTPVMFLLAPGFYFFLKKQRSVAICISVFFIFFIYICFSWNEWWYGAGAGQRAMVQAYAVLAFPLTAFFEQVKLKSVVGFFAGLFLGCAIFYNLWLIHQAHRGGLLVGGEMTREYFWKVLGKFRVQPQAFSLLDNPEAFDGDTSKPAASKNLEPV